MPNWCSNNLVVSGPAHQLDVFVKQAEGYGPVYKPRHAAPPVLPGDATTHPPALRPPSPLNFHSLAPVPARLLARTYGGEAEAEAEAAAGLVVDVTAPNHSGYNWEHANWGMKWGAVHARRERVGPTEVRYRFDTAWVPPVRFFTNVSARFVALKFDLWATIEHEEEKQHWLLEAGRAACLEQHSINFETDEIVFWRVEPRRPETPLVCLFCLAHLLEATADLRSFFAPVTALAPLVPAKLFGGEPVEALLFSRSGFDPPTGAGDLLAVYRYVGYLPADEQGTSRLIADPANHVDFRGGLQLMQDRRLRADGNFGDNLRSVRQIAFGTYPGRVNDELVASEISLLKLNLEARADEGR